MLKNLASPVSKKHLYHPFHYRKGYDSPFITHQMDACLVAWTWYQLIQCLFPCPCRIYIFLYLFNGILLSVVLKLFSYGGPLYEFSFFLRPLQKNVVGKNMLKMLLYYLLTKLLNYLLLYQNMYTSIKPVIRDNMIYLKLTYFNPICSSLHFNALSETQSILITTWNVSWTSCGLWATR